MLYAESSTSISANDFELRAGGVAGLGPGLYIASPNANQLPFGDGFLCLASPIMRLVPVDGPDIGIPTPIDLQGGLPSLGTVAAGSSLFFQLWYRDVTPAGFNLTDSLRVVFAP